MARIKVNGRYYDVADLILDIPDVCRIDFMSGLVTKYPENTSGKIEGRLIVLLNYLYHRDGYTSLDTIINDLYDGYAAEGSIKADINSLRKRIFDEKDEDGDYRIIQNARGRGYRLVLPTSSGSTEVPADTPNYDLEESYDELEDTGTVINSGSYTPLGDDNEKENAPSVKAMLIRMRTGETFPIQKLLMRIGSSRYQADAVDIVISNNEHINRVHAEIRSGGKFFFIRELRATASTRINGQVLQLEETAQLGECSEIILGDELFFFLSGHACDYSLAEGKLCAVCSRDTGETRLIFDTPLLLDRHHPWRQNILKDPRISRSNQAKLYREAGKTYLVDTGSKNGTWHNKRCLVPGEAIILKSGDSISIVDTVFSYYEIDLYGDSFYP